MASLPEGQGRANGAAFEDVFGDVLAERKARKSTYRPRPRKARGRGRSRRTKAEMQELREVIYDTCAGHHPLIARNLFYLLVSAGHIEKAETAYKNIVVRLAGEMREAGEIPWSWLVDGTRLMRKPDSFTGLEHLLEQSAQFYRRDLWAQCDHYLEVWCESESIGGVIADVTEEYDVPLMAARGFSSKAFLFNSAATIAYHEKPTTIYYVGDYDPSGVVARNDVYARLSRYLDTWHNFEKEFDFIGLAVTEDQIETFDLPTKPPKIRGNTHAKSIGWRDDQGTVEAEALNPEYLRMILRDAIERHLPAGHLERLRSIEEEERRTLGYLQAQVAEGLVV